MWKYYNPNPKKKIVGDCVIRAVSLALGESWQDVYSDITVKGFILADMPSSDAVWGSYIRGKGFKTRVLPDTCPACYTLREFCEDHPKGTYIVKLDNHVVTVIDGDYYDTWDSGDLIPIFYYTKER
jgi:hypothetical protein